MDGDDKLRRVKEKPAVINGYSMLAIPSPAPERLKSPLMTWGELNETPMRIDRSYNVLICVINIDKIPKTPPREQLGS
jgi:protein DGCR14